MQLTVPAVPSYIIVIYHSSILLVIATCAGLLTGDHTDEVVVPRGPGRVMFPITPSTRTSTASCTWHTACVDALWPASFTVVLGERHGLCLAHPACSLQGAGLLPRPHDLLCLLVPYVHGSIDLGSC
jgi:hypothetical protein